MPAGVLQKIPITDNSNPHLAGSGTQAAYRDYDKPAMDRVRTFYRNNYQHQTYAFVAEKKARWLPFQERSMTPWEGLDFLNTLVDQSDPDTALPQIMHLLQTAEAIRADGHPDWFVLTGLIHDLGKVLCPPLSVRTGALYDPVPQLLCLAPRRAIPTSEQYPRRGTEAVGSKIQSL